MKLVTDSSALYSPQEGLELGIKVLPLTVTVNNKTYTEFVDMDSKTFLEMVKQPGTKPTSSQPPVGKTLELFEEEKDEMLVLCMADGLSGTYGSIAGAREAVDDNEHIHVVNTTTLCGPHRYMVQIAMGLQKEGKSLEEIMAVLQKGIDQNGSFLIADDFDFLKRGGRLTPLAATLGSLLKIVPVVIQTKDGKRLEKFSVKRTFKAAVKSILDKMAEEGVDSSYKLYVSHAGALENSTYIKDELNSRFNVEDTEILDLSPVFITQGGPGCIAVQYIKRLG